MYICLCTGTTEEEIRESIERGNNNLMSLMDDLRVSLGCGLCEQEVEKILIEKNQCAYRLTNDSLFNIIKAY